MLKQSHNYSKLSLEEKIGQLFFVGIPGEEIDAATEELLSEINPGGICLFARNTKSAEKTRLLVDAIRSRLPLEPFLSIDQEGGLVDRLRRISEPIPSTLDIFRSGDVSNAARLAKITAELIRILGLNMNFAPVIDVIPKDSAGCVMSAQKRIFGENKQEVTLFAGEYLRELQDGGVIGCLKHFPGIGGLKDDPHDGFSKASCSQDELFENEIDAYQQLFKNNSVHAVMLGHAVYPSLDLQETDANDKLLPASLSKNIAIELLRNRLGFSELALTDDLEMGAIVDSYGIGEASIMSIEAGNDFVLICNDPESMLEGYKSVLKFAKEGRITEKRIDNSLERIWNVRAQLKSPLEFNENRIAELRQETIELKGTLSMRIS